MKIKLMLLLLSLYTFNIFAADSSGTGKPSSINLECKYNYLKYLTDNSSDNTTKADSSGTGGKAINDDNDEKPFQLYLHCINQSKADSSGTG